MGALRHGVNTAGGIERRRPPLRGKALDIILVLGVTIPVAASFLLTLVQRLAEALGEVLIALPGPTGLLLSPLGLALSAVAPVFLSFGIFAFLLCVLPATRTTFRDVWPGAALAALGYELTKLANSLYLEYAVGFEAVYGSLGAAVALLLRLPDREPVPARRGGGRHLARCPRRAPHR
jgi:membrane protein